MLVESVIEGLKNFGIQYQTHTNGGLLSHLRGTHEILVRWNCPEALCLAGLCHSIYGTESYARQTVPLSERDLLKTLIGCKAERIAYLFGAHVKDSLWENITNTCLNFGIVDRFTNLTEILSAEELRALITLTLANWLEQRPRAPAEIQFIRKEEFILAEKFLPELAYDEFRAAYGLKF